MQEATFVRRSAFLGILGVLAALFLLSVTEGRRDYCVLCGKDRRVLSVKIVGWDVWMASGKPASAGCRTARPRAWH